MKIKKVINQRVRSVYNWNETFKLDKRFLILKIKNKGELIANLAIERNWIWYFSVNPKYRKMGYGKLILSKAEELIAKKYHKVKLVPKDNDFSLREYYTNLGYSGYTGNEPGYVAEDKTFWIMTKELGG